MRAPFATLLTTAILLTTITLPPVFAQTYNITTAAGGALPVNIPATSASLYGPQSALAVDQGGNLYFADGNTILKMDASTGLLTLIAGNGTSGYSGDGGPATSAQLRGPYGVAIDSVGTLYIASFTDHVVRKVTGGLITTVVGTGTAGFSGDNGPAAQAQLNNPYGIAVDSANNLFIADYGNSRIRMVSGGTITTVAGNGIAGFAGDNGPATSAELNGPHSIVVDGSGNIYIADTGNNRIRKVSAGSISTIAGSGAPGYNGDNGPAVSSQLYVPTGVTLDLTGNLLIADYYNNRIRKVSNGIISTIAGKGIQGFSGDGGVATNATLNDPFVVVVDPSGNLYIGDYGNNRIREVMGGNISTVAGNGTAGFAGDSGSAAGAQLHAPYSLALDSFSDLFFADQQNNRIREISAGIVNTLAGNGVAGYNGDNVAPTSAELSQPTAVAFDPTGNIYIADTGNNRIRKISNGLITTVVGTGTAGFSGDNGPATTAQLSQPAGIAFDSTGNMYISDTGNNRIRKVSAGTITTIAGNGTSGFSGDGGLPTSAMLHYPAGLAVDSSNNLYIADTGNHRIRKISSNTITTVAGNGTPGFSGDNGSATAAALYSPGGVWVSGTTLYIADTLNNCIRRVANGVITTIAGGVTYYSDGGPSTSSSLAGPQAVIVDNSGNVFIADTLDNRIRQMTQIPLSITNPSSLSDGTLNVAYPAVAFTASGGVPPYTWSATGLPKGLTLTAGGSLSGTPTVAGAATPQFTVKDAALTSVNVSLPINIDLPVPTISSTSPASATVYGAAFTLTVNGTGFITGAAIQWNGTSLTTKFVSATQLTASIPATSIATVGSAAITVLSGGSTSNSFSFPINAPTPTLKSLSPNSASATSAGFTMTATGTGFVSATQLLWNGNPLQTTFVSATSLTASVTPDLLATAGTASVTANSGGTPSSAVTFTITAPPSITSLAPASTVAYGPAFTLTVTGTGFVAGSVVQWGGTALATKFVSATQLTASVTAGTVGGAGSVSITVVSGGVTTAAFSYTINPPPPAITTLAPATATATGAAFTMAVNGTGFMQSSVVQWNGAPLPTTYVSATELDAYVASSLIASAGSATVGVATGTTSSATVKFTITAAPAITTLNPASVSAGTAGFTLAITGTGFISGAQVQWNGAAIPTTYVSGTQLTAAVASNLIGTQGTVTIQVSLGGATSNGSTFTINGPPVISSLSPAAATAGGAAFTLTVNGTGFVTGSAISWNGTSLTTKLVSATQLTAPITAALIASAGSVNVSVIAGGATSTPFSFSINIPPVISSLSPATVPGTGEAFVLSLNGTGFVSTSTVQWNSTALTTTFVSATQLTAAVPANLAAGTGSASITVVNPGPTTSTASKLAITAAKPAVTTGGVVPLFSATSVVQAGSWISIYGTGLANGTYTWKGDYPTALGGTSVKIDNKAAYLWYVSPTQINLQVPNDTTTGQVNVVVTTGSGSTTSTVTLAAYGPSLSQFGSNYVAGVILTPDGSGSYGGGTYDLVGPSGLFSFNTRPVRAGETLSLYGVGFGTTNPVVAAGKAFSGSAPTTSPVTVTIGGVNATVLFAGMTASGVYQINLTVPAASSGDQPLVASVNGNQTPGGVMVSIQ